jgi:hypothetical protein
VSAYQTEPVAEKSLGQIAYEAYCASLSHCQMPDWYDEVTLPVVRQAWEDAAQAVADKRDEDW